MVRLSFCFCMPCCMVRPHGVPGTRTATPLPLSLTVFIRLVWSVLKERNFVSPYTCPPPWCVSSLYCASPAFLRIPLLSHANALMLMLSCSLVIRLFLLLQASRGESGSLASAIAARSRRQAVTATPEKGAVGADFASEEMASHFEGLMQVLHLLLSLPLPMNSGGVMNEGHSVPPDLVRRGLHVLYDAHRKSGGLFSFSPFASRWLQPMLTDALRGLVEGAHPLLQEEVRRLVFNMAEVRRSERDFKG